MKKALFVFACLIALIGCSSKKELTGDLTGKWYIYKITRNNIDQSHLVSDSFNNYSITFTGDGKYVEQSVAGVDTLSAPGTWAFQNSYGQLTLTDTAMVVKTYTVFNLVGNHVELLRNSEDRYMRKFQ
ncbi:MAG: hypothetical protein JWO03_3280 [Bacteroidetes bacterium]|nr:hypothetical protein [Bacteroidota bacterium]